MTSSTNYPEASTLRGEAHQGGIRAMKKLAADAVVEDQTTKEWAAAELVRKAASATKKTAKKASGALKNG